MEWITQHILEILGLLGTLGTFIATIFWIGGKSKDITKSIEHLEKIIDKLDIKINDQINRLDTKIDKLENSLGTRIGRLENIYDSFVIDRMKDRASPLKLTAYAVQVLKDIEFDKIFDSMKEELCKRLDKFNVHTKYDVQEMSDYLMKGIEDDEICRPLKAATFAQGYKLREILSAASIPLRDYYLSIHPEIKD